MSSKVTVRIRNFQSLRSVDLELSGFTVITGPSNLGKSAVVRAMGAALFGILGDYYITDKPTPEDQCAVSVVDEKTSVKWWKVRDGKNSPTRNTSLEVNGTKYTKFGREQAQLTKDLGFVELEVAGQYIRPQIASQFDPIFLLSGSETEAAEVLRLLGRVDVVTEAQRLATRDARETAGKLKIRKDDSIAAQIKANELSWVPERKAALDKLSAAWPLALTLTKEREVWLEKVAQLAAIKTKKVPGSFTEVSSPRQLEILDMTKAVMALKARTLPAPVPEATAPASAIASLAKILELSVASKEYFAGVLERQNCERELVGLHQQKKQLEVELGKCPICDRAFN